MSTAAAPSVRLGLESKPETLTLVRGMLGGVAELLAFDPELLDDLKTAVSEACNNVVVHAYPAGSGPLEVFLYLGTGIEVLVRDQGRGIPERALTDDQAQGIGLPVIQALTERAEFRSGDGGGTEVWMQFAGERDGQRLFDQPAAAVPDNGWAQHLVGDTVVSLSPVSLLTGVLGRLARALAANVRFSLDRFSDVYLVTDAIAAHSSTAASGDCIGFAIEARERRLEFTVGPFREGSGGQLHGADEARERSSPIALLTDELAVEPVEGCEMLRAVLVDRQRWSATT